MTMFVRVKKFKHALQRTIKKIWFFRKLPTGLPTWKPERGWFWCHDDVFGRKFWFNEPYEVNERLFVKDFLDKGMVFVDAGANQGIYTVLASKACGRKGRVYAFEPCSSERRKLRWNLLWNRCWNVRVRKEALGSKKGDSELFVVEGQETGGNSLRRPAIDLAPTVSSQRIKVDTLDSILEQEHVKQVDFVKIDVEGGERDLFFGASRLLNTRPRPLIIFEAADCRAEPWGYLARELVVMLEDLGYIMYEIKGRIIMRHRLADKYPYLDLLAVPDEKIEWLHARMLPKGWEIH